MATAATTTQYRSSSFTVKNRRSPSSLSYSLECFSIVYLHYIHCTIVRTFSKNNQWQPISTNFYYLHDLLHYLLKTTPLPSILTVAAFTKTITTTTTTTGGYNTQLGPHYHAHILAFIRRHHIVWLGRVQVYGSKYGSVQKLQCCQAVSEECLWYIYTHLYNMSTNTNFLQLQIGVWFGVVLWPQFSLVAPAPPSLQHRSMLNIVLPEQRL